MRYQVMTRELGRPVEQIGEAELSEPLRERANGRFVPGDGYTRVRDVFRLRAQGKDAEYRNGRDWLGLRLYLDGVALNAERIDIDDPDRIEVVLTPADIVEASAVGSVDELLAAMVWHCPVCGTGISGGSLDYALPGTRLAARSWKTCPVCAKSYVVLFPAKPEWHTR